MTLNTTLNSTNLDTLPTTTNPLNMIILYVFINLFLHAVENFKVDILMKKNVQEGESEKCQMIIRCHYNSISEI